MLSKKTRVTLWLGVLSQVLVLMPHSVSARSQRWDHSSPSWCASATCCFHAEVTLRIRIAWKSTPAFRFHDCPAMDMPL